MAMALSFFGKKIEKSVDGRSLVLLVASLEGVEGLLMIPSSLIRQLNLHFCILLNFARVYIEDHISCMLYFVD